MNSLNSKVNRLLAKYPDKVPIIVEVDKNIVLKKDYKLKYLFPRDDTMGKFAMLFREKNINIDKNEGLFWFCNNKLILLSQTAKELWQADKKQGILYIKVCKENVFG